MRAGLSVIYIRMTVGWQEGRALLRNPACCWRVSWSTDICSVWQILVWFWGVGSVRIHSTEVISTLFYKHCPLSKDFQNFSGTFFPEFYLALKAPAVFLPRAFSPWNTQCVQTAIPGAPPCPAEPTADAQAAWQAHAWPVRAPHWCNIQAPKLLKAEQTLH